MIIFQYLTKPITYVHLFNIIEQTVILYPFPNNYVGRFVEYYRLKTVTRCQLALAYGISLKALRKKLERENVELPRGLVYPKEILLVIEKLGHPPFYEILLEDGSDKPKKDN